MDILFPILLAVAVGLIGGTLALACSKMSKAHDDLDLRWRLSRAARQQRQEWN